MTEEKQTPSDLDRSLASILRETTTPAVKQIQELLDGNAFRPPHSFRDLNTALSLPDHVVNPAKWAYERLCNYIKEFESDLDETQEIGAKLASFGQAITLHITDLGYHGPDFIIFHGEYDGQKVQLIQNISQLSVLLIALRAKHEKPRRIGFKLAHENSEE